VEYREFEASAHMSLPSDEVFQIAADPRRLNRWIPSELAPKGGSRPGGDPGGSDSDSAIGAGATGAGIGADGGIRQTGGGMRMSAAEHRLEWSTMTNGFETWLEVRADGPESDVTIHLSMPETEFDQPQLEGQLQQALRRLEAEANRGLRV
jgi:hypothetical protein